jgi:hypothetical protein
MSSAVTTAYDNLLTRLAAVLTLGAGWHQIPNAYDIPSNSFTFLKQGYGLAIGSATNGRRELSCNIHVDRTFIVSIAREVFKLDGDASGYGTVSKDLMEDLKLVIKDFETNATLNDGLINLSYENDSGVQAIEGDDFSAMYVSANFKAILIENLNV